jgi:hypothetical protein
MAISVDLRALSRRSPRGVAKLVQEQAHEAVGDEDEVLRAKVAGFEYVAWGHPEAVV